MRVLMVSHLFYPDRGGSPHQAWLLSRFLMQRAITVGAVTIRRPGLAAFEIVEDIPIYRVWARGGRGLPHAGSRAAYADALAFMVSLLFFLLTRGRAYDIFHAQEGIFPAVSVVIAARLLRKKCMVTFSATGISGNVAQLLRRWFNRAMIPIIRRSDAFVVLTDEGHAEVMSAGFDPARTLIIPNGVDVNLFQPQAKAPRAQTIVNLARFTYEKAQETLVRALALMEHREAQVIFAGKGPERPRIEQLTRDLELEARVQYLGEIADVAPVLANARIFALPSVGEGMSIALLEAMATGLPCVVSDIGGNRAVIQHGVNGLLFRTGDAGELARCLDDILSDDVLARNLGWEARRTVETLYGFERYGARHISLYRHLVEGTSLELYANHH